MVNEWTRDDLPTVDEAAETYMTKGVYSVQEGIALVLDAVVAHLNASGGLPASDDRWRRAHAIVEQERDQARESLRRLRDETDFDLFTVRDQLRQCRGEREQMTRYRDEWKARAEAAERERNAAEYAEAEMERDRDEWRASAGKWHGEWQKIAPAVTRDEVAGKLRQALNVFSTSDAHLLLIADNVLTLFGVGAEPDQVEAKAEELFKIANPTLEWAWASGPNEEAYRRMAAHVLGQEDRHVDQ